MEYENKIGPMICLSVKRVIDCKQEHSMRYYQIQFSGAKMAATQLHAFKVVRDGEELYLPTHMLKPDDHVWIDKSAFMADGSFTYEKSTTNKKECLPEDTKVYTRIETIVTTEEIIHFQVGAVSIQASCSHFFDIMRGTNKISVSASELIAGDMFKADISLLSPGNYILGSDGEMHKISEPGKEFFIKGIGRVSK